MDNVHHCLQVKNNEGEVPTKSRLLYEASLQVQKLELVSFNRLS